MIARTMSIRNLDHLFSPLRRPGQREPAPGSVGAVIARNLLRSARQAVMLIRGTGDRSARLPDVAGLPRAGSAVINTPASVERAPRW
jgi:hypothetical protein